MGNECRYYRANEKGIPVEHRCRIDDRKHKTKDRKRIRSQSEKGI